MEDLYRIGCVLGDIERVLTLPYDAESANKKQFERFCLYALEQSNTNLIPNRMFGNIYGDVYVSVSKGEHILESIDDLVLLYDRERQRSITHRRSYSKKFYELCAKVAATRILCMHGFLHTHPMSKCHLNWKKIMSTEFPFENYIVYLQTTNLPEDLKNISISARVCGVTFGHIVHAVRMIQRDVSDRIKRRWRPAKCSNYCIAEGFRLRLNHARKCIYYS